MNWDERFRQLEVGEKVLATDECYDNGKWTLAQGYVGKPAPDPRFTAHCVFRRLIDHSPTAKLKCEIDILSSRMCERGTKCCITRHTDPPTPEPAESEGKMKIKLDTPEAKERWEQIKGASAEVANWPPELRVEAGKTCPCTVECGHPVERHQLITTAKTVCRDCLPTAPPTESVEDRKCACDSDGLCKYHGELEDRAKAYLDNFGEWTGRERDYFAHDMASFAQAEIERQTPAIIDQKQSDVWRWCEETFEGVAAWQTDKERAYRFFEEAGELFQAMGMAREDAIKVVDYVYGRPVGELSQEIGGVMVTLFALASQQTQSVSESFETEYERIIRPEIQAKIRNKQLAKNQAFL